MQKTNFIQGLIAIMLLSLGLSAQDPKSKVLVQNFLKDEPISFIENKGQLADEKGQLLPDIKYYGEQGGVYVYMRANRLSFVFTKVTPIPEKENETQKKLHQPDKFKKPAKANVEAARMDMDFLGANPEPEIVAEEKLEAPLHFYGSHIAEQGITDVNGYSKLTYKNIYPNIDLVLDSKEKGMEYSFIVRPGGIVADIKIQWNGADKMENIQDGGITYANQYGMLNQSSPTSFTSEGNIKSSFVINNNITTFKVDNYDTAKTITIDPTLTWSTFYGDSLTGGDRVVVAPNGDVVLQGGTYMTAGIATSGAYRTSLYTGGVAVFLVKFNSLGNRIWGTYFFDFQGYLTDIAVSSKGNIFITGSTNYAPGLSTPGVYQEYVDTFYWFRGPVRTDAYLVRFSSSGKKDWGTFFGGHWADLAYVVTTDRNENVYITGKTYSDSFIATPGAFQMKGGDPLFLVIGSTFLAKFDSSGGLDWATYYGDGLYNNSYGSGVVCDDTGNVYFIGYTFGDTSLFTPGAYKNSSGGLSSFLAKFSSAGKRLWGTYLEGWYTTGIAINRKGELYTSGSTGSIPNIASSGAYQTSCAGLYDCFLTKFDASGKFYWSTYFGGSQDDMNTGLAIDEKNNVCISGNTLSNNGISTSNGYQVKKDSLLDGFCARFNGAGKLLWASYYGGNGKDQVDDISMDNSGNLYLAGQTGSSNLTGTKGAFKTNVSWKNPLTKPDTYLGTALLAKFRLSLGPGIRKDTNVCSAGSTMSLGTTAVSGHTYTWTSKPSGFTSTVANPSVSPTVTTTYYLTESDSFESSSDSVKITIDTTCVWPGDANRDKIVNNHDLLNLGLGFGTKGKLRPSASLTWAAQPAPDWTDTLTNKINYKQADCNGDSTINYSDTMAITTNYSLTHLKTYSFNQGSPTDPHLSLILSKDSAKAGDIVKADIMYGNNTIPASNIYGLAFSVIYPAGLVDTVLADYSASWLSNNNLSISKTAASGQLDMAVVRTDKKDTSGFGKLATLYFKLGTSLPKAYTKLNISLAENTQINAKGQYKPVYMQSDSMLVKQTFTGLDGVSTIENISFSVSPNPANSEVILHFSENINGTLSLRDMAGREVLPATSISTVDYKLNTAGIAAGIYMLNISAENFVLRKKLIIQH